MRALASSSSGITSGPFSTKGSSGSSGTMSKKRWGRSKGACGPQNKRNRTRVCRRAVAGIEHTLAGRAVDIVFFGEGPGFAGEADAIGIEGVRSTRDHMLDVLIVDALFGEASRPITEVTSRELFSRRFPDLVESPMVVDVLDGVAVDAAVVRAVFQVWSQWNRARW